MPIICPHCGKAEGFYETGYISGTTTTYYDSEGKEKEDEFEIDYGYDRRLGSVDCYCMACNEDITKIVEEARKSNED